MTAEVPGKREMTGSRGDTRPVPDPTLLTTQQIERELSSLKALIEARLDGMDNATRLLQSAADKMPTEVDVKVAHLQELVSEKFHSVEKQFSERDVRTEQTSRDSKVAVDAALQAAKEAVAEQNRSSALAISKSEAATSKQIDQQGALIASVTKAFDDKIGDLKDRLALIEGRLALIDGRSGGYSTSWGVAVVVAGLLISLAVYLRGH